jgi:hypothetical protein
MKKNLTAAAKLLPLAKKDPRRVRLGTAGQTSIRKTKQYPQPLLCSGNLREIYSVNSTSSGFTIIGICGVGKTTGIEKVLKLYPQKILHTQYKSKPLYFCNPRKYGGSPRRAYRRNRLSWKTPFTHF